MSGQRPESDADVDADTPGEVTELLRRMASGDQTAEAALYQCLMPELRRLARAAMRGQPAGHSLQPTALINEAYLKLLHHASSDWRSRGHFLALASRAMRSILVDHARQRRRLKRGGGDAHESIEEIGERIEPPGVGLGSVDLLDLDEALESMGREYPAELRVVELRAFAGLTNAEVSRATGRSLRSVERDWRFAKAELARRIERGTR